ncbi:MAG: hypothetical protein KGM49_11000 [Sphingomonadales bacterium]|nr:hypothetical protein [Sphingomonadales bacterium]
MTARTISHGVIIATALLTLTNCKGQKAQEAATAAPATAQTSLAAPTDPIASAMSAAPAAVAKNAAIVKAGADGKMETLRPGTNGWTCMPDSPDTPGPDPMCFDANAGEWVAAWAGHKPPPTDKPGLMYMLEGGTDASNTDPYASKPTGGDDWLHTGPHLMLVGSTAALKGYPSGPKPDVKAPYVMWAGTPYAHLMVPVN